MKLAKILSGVPVTRQDADPGLEISGIAYDSRLVKPGSLFAAVPGFKTDGHDYVPQAKEAGAAVILTERWLEDADVPQVQTRLVRRSLALAAANFYAHPSRAMTLVGVTGTNGKTTTTYLLDSILRADGKNTGLIGGIEYHVGGTAIPADRTTPESVDIQKMLADMVAAAAEAVSMEVSSHGIDLYRVAALDFDVAVFTNLSRDHLDLHGDMESYFRTKRRLFTGSLEDEGHQAPPGKRPLAVVNIDDRYGRRLAEELAEAVGFGLSPDADVSAENVRRTGRLTSFDLVTPAGRAPATLKLPGDYNLQNALAAAAAAFTLGVSTGTIAEGIGASCGVPGRFEVIETGTPFTVVIDYAHNEDGLTRALAAAREITGNRLIAVFGCPGERDRDKRPEMGRIAGISSDLAILTTDDCYGEPPERILDEAEPGLKESGAVYLRIADRRAAIEAAIEAAGPGDTVFIAGKGHETRQIMAAGPVPFSDAGAVREIISGC